MTERAQALEAAVRALIEPMCERVTDNGIVRQKMLVVAGDDAFDRYRRVVELLAVPPPPPVGSPTTERDQLREALAAIQQSTRDDEKGEQWTIRNFLNKHGVFNDDISGSRRLVAEACRYVLSTPVEPAGASEPSSDDLPELWRQKVYPSIAPDVFQRQLCDLTERGWDDVRSEVMALQSIVASRPAPVSPVEPEPPTRGRIDKCPDPRCGCSMEHSPDCAMPAPTGAPAPCVWREDGPTMATGCGVRNSMLPHNPIKQGWKVCPYCKAPLTVER